VVEGVEGLEPELKFKALREREGLEECHIEVEEPGQDDLVFSGIPPTLICTAIPRGKWGRKRSLTKPCGPCLGVCDASHLVRTVGGAATQPESVGAVIVNGLRDSRLYERYSRELPASQGDLLERVAALSEEWEHVDVVHVEDLTPVERARPMVVAYIEWI